MAQLNDLLVLGRTNLIGAVSAPGLFTELKWTGGSAAGPIVSITIGGVTKTATIPSASQTASGIVTTGAQSINGSKTFTSGHIYLGGSSAGSSTGNTTQLVFGTSSENHVAVSANDNALVINPTTSSTTNQIVLYLNQASVFPSGINANVTGNLSGNATTATGFASAKTIALTGNVTGSATGGNGSNGWSIATTIGTGVVTNAMLAGSIANGKLANSSITIAGTSVSLGGSITKATLQSNLGLGSNAYTSTAYLPLAGGTMTGTINGTENTVLMNFRPANASYYATISSQTAGNEALVFATVNAVTSFIFVNGEDSVTNHDSSRWQSLTPGLQIKNNCVAINKLIGNGTTPSYTLDVNGTGHFNGNIYVGTSAGGGTGLSLYATSAPTMYGIHMSTTSNYSTHGDVLSDWATYFCMNAVGQRGWIFRAGETNVASISCNGIGAFNGVGNGSKYIAFPGGGEYQSNGATGYLRIALPTASYKSATMVKFKVSIFNYVQNTSVDYLISGYTYTDGTWHQVTAVCLGKKGQTHSNHTVRFTYDTTRMYVCIGESTTTWSYPNVTVSDVTVGHSGTFNQWKNGWEITITTTSGTVDETISNTFIAYNANVADSAGTCTGNSATATALTSSAGGATTPIYFSGGKPVACTMATSGNYFGALTSIGGDGVMEIGKYIDFHASDGATTDYDYRLTAASGSLTGSGTFTATSVYGAVWNDYAEFRNQTEEIEPGYCVISSPSGKVSKTTSRRCPCDGIVSDTYGFAIGETDNCKTPLATSGRVLAYYSGDISNYTIGDAVCADADGKVSKMTREEIREWPDRIVGTVSEFPTYETWGSGNVEVNGRIWIKVK